MSQLPWGGGVVVVGGLVPEGAWRGVGRAVEPAGREGAEGVVFGRGLGVGRVAEGFFNAFGRETGRARGFGADIVVVGILEVGWRCAVR